MKRKTFSVSDILLYYFNLYQNNNITSKKEYTGLFIHKILKLYFKYNNDFNLLYFLNSKKKFFNDNEINKIVLIVNKLKIILKEKKWNILFYETDFFYNNLFGKPDAIYYFNKINKFSDFSLSLFQYFYSIKSNCVDTKIFLNNIGNNIYNENNENNENNIILVDWKCSTKDIFFCNNTFSNNYLKKYLYNTLYNKFLIQMNIYKYILEKKKFNVIEMYICLLNINNLSIKFIPIYFLQEYFIEEIIKYFVENKNESYVNI